MKKKRSTSDLEAPIAGHQTLPKRFGGHGATRLYPPSLANHRCEMADCTVTVLGCARLKVPFWIIMSLLRRIFSKLGLLRSCLSDSNSPSRSNAPAHNDSTSAPGSSDDLESLIELLVGETQKAPRHRNEGDWSYRAAEAVEALGNSGDVRAVEPLIAALAKSTEHVKRDSSGLRSTAKEVCRKAAEALGNIGDVRAVEPLIDSLTTGQVWVVGKAAQALAKIGDARAVDALVARLKYGVDRTEIINALGKIGDVRAVTPLAELLRKAQNQEEKIAVLGVLRKFGARAVEPIIESLRTLDVRHEDNRFTLVDTLAKIGDSRAIPALIAALSYREWMVRRSAAEGLVRLFRSGLLDKDQAKVILSHRDTITTPHIVRPGHANEWGHYVGPIDEGIGVEFSLLGWRLPE